MYAQITLKMDRPIDKNKHYISPGGYEVTLKDSSTIAFDFCDSEGYIDELDPSIITFDLHADDYDAFSDMTTLLDRYREIKSLSECYIHTGEHNDPEINVERIINFTLIEKKTEPTNNYCKPESTSCINVRHEVISNTDDSIAHITEYSFTRTALDNVLANS